jgi:hypothetical protein
MKWAQVLDSVVGATFDTSQKIFSAHHYTSRVTFGDARASLVAMSRWRTSNITSWRLIQYLADNPPRPRWGRIMSLDPLLPETNPSYDRVLVAAKATARGKRIDQS